MLKKIEKDIASQRMEIELIHIKYVEMIKIQIISKQEIIEEK